MSYQYILIALGIYFFTLLGIAYLTAKNADKNAYFLGNKKSLWWLVAIGMLSDSMSGISFVSAPGKVVYDGFTYMQTVAGYVLGYFVIAYILLPIYYKLNLTSIYTFLQLRFGNMHQQIGAAFFAISRLFGAGARLYVAAMVLHTYLFVNFGFHFSATVLLIIALILIYTYRGGIKTLVFTDALQSFFLIGSLVAIVVFSFTQLQGNENIITVIGNSGMTRLFEWDILKSNNFWKHFIGGMLITITMTGLDQNMMQKNLSCKNIKEAQKNIISSGIIIFLVNIIFVSVGVLMYVYLQKSGIEIPLNAKGKIFTDKILPLLAMNHLGAFTALAFVCGLSAATFSSADSVLTALTTSVYFDFLRWDKNNTITEEQKEKYRKLIHLGFAVLLFVVILVFYALNVDGLIDVVLQLAGYTYGPLLGLFAIGILTKASPKGLPVLIWSIACPLIIYAIGYWFKTAKMGYQFGNEIILYNGLLTFLGYYLIALTQKSFTEKNVYA